MLGANLNSWRNTAANLPFRRYAVPLLLSLFPKDLSLELVKLMHRGRNVMIGMRLPLPSQRNRPTKQLEPRRPRDVNRAASRICADRHVPGRELYRDDLASADDP